MTQHIRGFTLLEILIAFTVLATLGGILLQLIQGGLRNVDSAERITHAALLARSKLHELIVADAIVAGTDNGSFDDGYRWQLELTPYSEEEYGPLPESSLRGLRTRLVIEWQPDGRYQLDTLLLARGENP